MRVRVIGLLAAVALLGCQQATREVTLAELVADTAGMEGRKVLTRGEVVAFDTDDGALVRHIVVQDHHPNRVQLEPIEEAEPYVGLQVEVRGTFRFDPEVGRILEIEAITQR